MYGIHTFSLNRECSECTHSDGFLFSSRFNISPQSEQRCCSTWKNEIHSNNEVAQPTASFLFKRDKSSTLLIIERKGATFVAWSLEVKEKAGIMA